MAIKVKNIDYAKKAKAVIRSKAFFNEENLSNKQVYNRYYSQYKLFKEHFPNMSSEQIEREVYFNLVSDMTIQEKARTLGSYHDALVYNLEEQFSGMASTYSEVRTLLNWFAEGELSYNEFLEWIKEFKEDPNSAYMRQTESK